MEDSKEIKREKRIATLIVLGAIPLMILLFTKHSEEAFGGYMLGLLVMVFLQPFGDEWKRDRWKRQP